MNKISTLAVMIAAIGLAAPAAYAQPRFLITRTFSINAHSISCA